MGNGMTMVGLLIKRIFIYKISYNHLSTNIKTE